MPDLNLNPKAALEELVKAEPLQIRYDRVDLDELDELLYPLLCAKCKHTGEDHCAPAYGGECCIARGTPGACTCPGFEPPSASLVAAQQKLQGEPPKATGEFGRKLKVKEDV